MPDPIRLLIDPPLEGAWNMSLDEALLHSVARGESPDTLRFYQWSAPTLSLGYFQGADERQGHEASRECALVRRSSGGGAIMHDRELTYCLVLNTASRFAARDLYDGVHQALIEVLAGIGVEAELFVPDPSAPRSKAEPFLCFQRRAPGDVICKGMKICGSAQRRQGSAVLQHGSLLLEKSPFAPELPGVSELGQKPISLDALRAAWSETIARQLARPLTSPESWQDSEITAAREWRNTRFGGEEWTYRR